MAYSKISVRDAQDVDQRLLANLIHFEVHVHRHLDWRLPLDWIGFKPYLVGEFDGNVQMALICPPDPPHIAWIRLFAVASTVDIKQAWQALWPVAQEQLSNENCIAVAAIAIEPWFQQLLQDASFIHVHDIISLIWESDVRLLPALPVAIRLMRCDDLPAVAEIDKLAFVPLWHNSLDALEIAFRQSVIATVTEEKGRLMGYQISTAGPMGGHLARLAVHPDCWGHGLGHALVRDVLERFARRGTRRVSVNTQNDNIPSLALYRKLGFQFTEESFPVYQFT